MIAPAKLQRFAAVFGAAFALCYAAAVKFDIALFTIYPSLGIVVWGTQHSRDAVAPSMGFAAPAMYWYGWLAFAAVGAALTGLLAVCLPQRWATKHWAGWVWLIPLGSMAACVYLARIWFQL